MSRWLYIRNTGVNILEILEILSRGGGMAEIRRRFPQVTRRDLTQAAGIVLNYIVTHIPSDILSGTPDRAGASRFVPLDDNTAWTVEEDEELRRLVRYRFRIDSVARLLRRSEQAVRARTARLLEGTGSGLINPLE